MTTRIERRPANFLQIILLLACSFVAAWSEPALAEFVVSAAKGCAGAHPYKPANEEIYGYEFWGFSEDADVTISVVSTPVPGAVLIEVVGNPRDADLILVDEYSSADMYVCKPTCSYCGFKSVSVVNNINYWTDVVVAVTSGAPSPDYKIYISGDTFSLEQAVSLFPAIWFLNRQ